METGDIMNLVKGGAGGGAGGGASGGASGGGGVQSWLWYVVLAFLALVVLSPGMLATLPPAKDCDDNARVFFSGQTSFAAVFVHSILIVLVLGGIWAGGRALQIPKPAFFM